MALWYTPSNGWLVALFHQVSETAWPDAVAEELVPAGADELELLDPPLLHAAAAVAVAAARAMAASARLLRMKVISRRGWPEADRRTF
jgi:hypothetical protein